MGVIGNIYIIITGIYYSGGNLDKFINAGGLYNINKFYNTGIFSYNSGKRG